MPTPRTGDALGGLASGWGCKQRRRSPSLQSTHRGLKPARRRKRGENPVLICLVNGN